MIYLQYNSSAIYEILKKIKDLLQQAENGEYYGKDHNIGKSEKFCVL